jgi:hypothetical protein
MGAWVVDLRRSLAQDRRPQRRKQRAVTAIAVTDN